MAVLELKMAIRIIIKTTASMAKVTRVSARGFLLLSPGKIILNPLCIERDKILPAQIMLTAETMPEIPGFEGVKKSLLSQSSLKRSSRRGIPLSRAIIAAGEALKAKKRIKAIKSNMGAMESRNP